jgi:hypothetical protein
MEKETVACSVPKVKDHESNSACAGTHLYTSVISVATHDSKSRTVFYYNPRPPVEFGAPGIDVRVAWYGGGLDHGHGK